MRPYEMVVILDPSVEGDEAVDAQLSRFVSVIQSSGGELEKVDKWGKRKLAYEIDGNTEGYYTVVEFKSNSEAVAELDRVLKITDGVIRHLLVRKEE